MLYSLLYRTTMRLLHHFHLHYAPPIYPEGDTQLWCQWCGFRQTIRRRGDVSRLDPAAHEKPAG